MPLLTPSLSSHWIGLVTPVPVPLARELVESLVNEVVVDDDRAGATFGVRAMGPADGIRRAVAAVERAKVPTTWSGADLVHFAPVATDPEWSGGTSLADVRHAKTLSSPETVYDTIAAIGGERGWYSGEILWQIRGVLDKLVGGPGSGKAGSGRSPSATPLTFGGSRTSVRGDECGCGPRWCCRAGRG